MGGKGSGGSRPNSGNGVEKVDRETNHRVIMYTMAVANMERCDLTDPDAIRQRLFDFLELCDEWGMRPAVSSYATALGMSRQRLWDVTRKDYDQTVIDGTVVTRESIDEIKKGYNFLEQILENLMLADKGNPVKYFFLAKNHFGYKDQSEQININVEERPTLPTADELAEKYRLDLGQPEEVTYELPEGT